MKFTAKSLFFVVIFVASTLAFAENNFNEIELTKVIKAGSHTIEENERHRKICQQQGGIDVTDLSDIQLASNTTDAVICSFPPSINFGATALPLDESNASSLSAEAPNGVFNFAPYLIRGYSYFSDARVGSALFIGTGVPADRCGVAAAVAVTKPLGSSYLQASCSYPSSRGAHQSYTEAKLEGLYNKSYGTINLR